VFPATLVVMGLGLPATLLLSPRRALRGGIGAVAALIVVVATYMLLRALGIGPVGSLFAKGVLKQKDWIVVSDFRAVHADSTFGAMLAEAVPTGLSQSDAISVVDGDVAGVPGGYVASLRLVATEDGKELASFHEAADTPRALIQAADQLVRDLRAKLGESLRTVNAMPELYDWTTSSTDALRAFALAIRAGRAGHVEDAVRHYREAVGIDSTFAMAWANLGTALKVLGLNAAADSAQRHAYALKDHLTRGEQLYLTANYFGFPCQRDPVKAADAFQQLVDLGDSLKRGRS
jgi:hypothetical protein